MKRGIEREREEERAIPLLRLECLMIYDDLHNTYLLTYTYVREKSVFQIIQLYPLILFGHCICM